MKTEVIMKRELFGELISQSSKTEYFSATDLVKAGNKWRILNGHDIFVLGSFLNQKGTKEFIEELELKYGKVKVSGRGRGSHTWVHPLLFIEIALAINPKLKVEVYEWLFDHLIKLRNDSGDSYRKMSAQLYSLYSNKKEFPKFIEKVALYIKEQLGVKNWQEATKEHLDKRNKIHHSIITLSNVLNNPTEIVRLAVMEHTIGFNNKSLE